MRNFLLAMLLCSGFSHAQSQEKKGFHGYLQILGTPTVHADMIRANPLGVGIGLQGLYYTGSHWHPMIDFSANGYFVSDKVYYENALMLDHIHNLFAGLQFRPGNKVYLALVAGPSLVGRELDNVMRLGVKPTIGAYFRQGRVMMSASYLNVFNASGNTGKDYGGLCLAIGFRLF